MSNSKIASSPEPPYYAVIFTSVKDGDEGYAEAAAQMEELAAAQDGFVGIESARSEIGITVSYWRDRESIRAWARQVDHVATQKRGKVEWYSSFTIRVCLVERQREWSRGEAW